MRRADDYAEDVVQEILLAVHLKQHTWDETRPITPWVAAIARYKLIDALRRSGAGLHLPIEDFADLLPAEEARVNAGPDIAHSLDPLPARQREVHDVAQAAMSARFLFKPLLMVALAAIAGLQLRRLIRPGDPARLLWLALIPAALAGAVTAELATLPQSQWLGALIGHNWYKCISLIPLLSLPVIAALLWALRYGAPTHPGIAGAVAGMMASGLAGALYAINCTDDSPLFVAAWYSVAVVTVSLVGAVAGRKLLRW